jgi:hypothetical protein
VDEATGFQRDRTATALALILEYFGVLTNDIVYNRRAAGVLDQLKKGQSQGRSDGPEKA